MNNMKSSFAHFLVPFFILLSTPLLAWDYCNPPSNYCPPCSDPCCDSSWGINGEFRVAYYHPSSKRVRRIYGDGWADYQFELSKSFNGFGRVGQWCGCSRF